MMISKRCFRFGLPLGSAAIVAAMLDTTIGIYWLINDLGSSLFFHWLDHNHPIDKITIVNLALISIRLLLALSLWIFVLFKQRLVLIFWIPLSVILDCVFIVHAILSHPEDFISDELWIANIFFLFLFRLYITSVIFQTLIRLLRNARLKTQPVSKRISTCPENEICSVPNMKYFLVEPIGRNPCKIWEYYDRLPRLGAAVLVAFEIAWALFALSTHALTEFLLGGRIFFLHTEEEIIMRIWRVFIDLFALYFILKKKKTLLRFWLIIYFWSLFISIALTIWSVVEWTFETPLVVVLSICYCALSDIILRFGVLYSCLMVSLQTSVRVSRTHSLKSETRSVHPNNNAKLSIEVSETSPASTVLLNSAGANARNNHSLSERAIFLGIGNEF